MRELKMELQTKIVMPPMATETSNNGKVTEALCEFYRVRVENPLSGLIITEHMYIEPCGKASKGQMSAADDDVVDGLKKLTKIVHEAKPGLKVVAQINHAGGRTTPEITGCDKASASPYEYNGSICREMTVEEIHEAADRFAEAAGRVKAGGYDGVEIHSAHGYLLCQFYSPVTNHRTDEYGPQSMENRLRFHKEVLEKVRAVVGEDFPVFVRLGGCDYMDGGSTEEDAVEAAKLLEQYGADVIDVSGGMCSYRRPDHTEPGYFASMSKKMKEAVSIPVLVTGGVTVPEDANQLLEEGAADLVGVGRALLKNPRWGMERRLEEVKTDSKEIFDGHILHVYKDTVELPNGKEAYRELIRHIGAVAVVPLTDDGKVIVERQLRYPLGQVITEIPAGKLDSFDEDRLEAIKRELREETGYVADQWMELGDYHPAAAYTDERITLYLATGLHKGERELDDDEFLDVMEVPLVDLVSEIAKGNITDGKTQVAILKTYLLLKE
ncbi:MAG: NUDIX domain-containing protein [Firmicutes bacterium]|nr:NUDIX domain-containing protein [Bacillota bacterium]